jgi:subtilisin family serine protease
MPSTPRHRSASRWFLTLLLLGSLLVMTLGAVPASAAPPHGWVEVIVQAQGAQQAAEAARTHGGEVTHHLGIINAVAVRLPEPALDGLRHNPHVVAIFENRELQIQDYLWPEPENQPVGTEARVNTTTSDVQNQADVAYAADGSYTVVWTSAGQDGDLEGVYYQRFDANGNPIGGEIQVNTYTAEEQEYAAIAMDPAGNSVVVWQSKSQDRNRTYGVYLQRFDASGNKVGPESRVNTPVAGYQEYPDVAMDANGNFVVVWDHDAGVVETYGVHMRHYDATGTPLTGDIIVNSTIDGIQQRPSIAMAPTGEYVIVWTSNHPDLIELGDTQNFEIFGQRFDASGNPVGGEFQINTTTADYQVDPSVAMDDAGDFVVAWRHGTPYVPSFYTVYARRYDSEGVPLSGEFQVPTTLTGFQYGPSAVMQADGGFTIAWYGDGVGDGPYGVFARKYNSAGIALGDEFLVNSTVAGDQAHPSMAIQSDGSFAVVWNGYGPGDDSGVFVQRYAASLPAPDTAYPTLVGANQLHAQNVTGSGVTVAVVDTGYWSHPDLDTNASGQSRLLAHYNAISDQMEPAGSDTDDSGHGSHVTSVLLSSQQTGSGLYNGVAPDSDLVSVKAFDASGSGSYADVIRAIDWVVANKDAYGIRVLNLSFSTPPQSHYWEDPLNQAVMQAWQAGLVVVAAAGNDGPGAMSVGVPGNVPYVITAGALSDNETPGDPADDFLTEFSSAGPTVEGFVKPDVLAPGDKMLGLMPASGQIAQAHPEFYSGTADYYTLSGTSQATAVTSGIVALMLEANPALTPDDVKCRLLATARPALDGEQLTWSVFQQGRGLVHAPDAVYSTETGCANQGLDVGQDLAGTAHYGGYANQDLQRRRRHPCLSSLRARGQLGPRW